MTSQAWQTRAFMATPASMAAVATGRRAALSLTREQAATLADVPPALIDQIEAGAPARLDVDGVYRLFDALGVKVLALPGTLIGLPG